jgi:hypothetical protein
LLALVENLWKDIEPTRAIDVDIHRAFSAWLITHSGAEKRITRTKKRLCVCVVETPDAIAHWTDALSLTQGTAHRELITRKLANP